MYKTTHNLVKKIYYVTIDDVNTIVIDETDIFIINDYKSKTQKYKWIYNDENKFVYSTDTNGKSKYLVELITNKPFGYYTFSFKDGDTLNYKRDNLEYTSKFEKYIDKNLTIIESYDRGHVQLLGKSANKVVNPYWKVKENDTLKEYYIMYCNEGAITKISSDTIDIIFDTKAFNGSIPSWYLMKNGYIGAHTATSIMYLHALLMNHYGFGAGNFSVDHINQDKLDNRTTNLRIVDQSEQNRNRGKPARKCNAQPLPECLSGITLPKFVTYNKEKITSKDGSVYYREFFRIEKHAKLDKVWSTTKSINVDLLTKYEEAKTQLDILDGKMEAPIPTDEGKMPTYCFKGIAHGKHIYTYERRVEDINKTKIRQSTRYTLKPNDTHEYALNILRNNILTKFNYDIFS